MHPVLFKRIHLTTLSRHDHCLTGIMHGFCKCLLVYILTCLSQNAHGEEIIHGVKAPENSMLYMASVQDSIGHICGGFLVSEDFVITAAHCGRSEITHVVLGTHNLKKADNDNKRYILHKYIPASYVAEGFGNDIMLLKLSRKAKLGKRVQTIPLPRSDTKVKENQKCQVAGWGFTTTGGIVVDELRVVDVSIISPQVCKHQWIWLPLNVTCAGGYGTNKGFCQGDSGGPLVCDGLPVGIVSFNKYANCNYPDVPNVYTDVTKHLSWIKEIIR
ncbi:granzyme-like protein 1 [Mastacembelus armatus]|uniref:trypsin n=1 Tax=Mastacembelus armatus TaxID=205130 RepID=A0A3Q3N956_9TELE|nr:granzyme-like protein 1 [Mastacembelus armatus]XP_026161397.1 granzyme-like protein 1 [Mastacembelus armatus]